MAKQKTTPAPSIADLFGGYSTPATKHPEDGVRLTPGALSVILAVMAAHELGEEITPENIAPRAKYVSKHVTPEDRIGALTVGQALNIPRAVLADPIAYGAHRLTRFPALTTDSVVVVSKHVAEPRTKRDGTPITAADGTPVTSAYVIVAPSGI